jgi:hypothetical protein
MSTPASLLLALNLPLTLGLIGWLLVRDLRRHKLDPLDLVISIVMVLVAADWLE